MKNFSAKQPEKVMDDLIPQQEINQSVENLLIEDKPVEPEIIEHVAKQSLEEHEEELANLLKEAQRDSPDQEIEQVVQREKDEGNFKSEKFSYLSVLIRVNLIGVQSTSGLRHQHTLEDGAERARLGCNHQIGIIAKNENGTSSNVLDHFQL